MGTKLLFVVTEDWYLVSHRLSLAVAAQAAEFDVVVATREGQQAEVIRSAGIRLIPFALSRRGGNLAARGDRTVAPVSPRATRSGSPCGVEACDVRRVGGVAVHSWPLSAYRNKSFDSMRTDALDRFGIKLEKRFTKLRILTMMKSAGLERVQFSPRTPFWCAVGFRK